MTDKKKRRKLANKLVKQMENDKAPYLLVFIDPEDGSGNYNIQHAGAKPLAWLILEAANNHDLFAMLWVELNAMRIAREIQEPAKEN